VPSYQLPAWPQESSEEMQVLVVRCSRWVQSQGPRGPRGKYDADGSLLKVLEQEWKAAQVLQLMPVLEEVARRQLVEVAFAPVMVEVAFAPILVEVASAPLLVEVAFALVLEEVAFAPVLKVVARQNYIVIDLK